jgi:hypothetical protein
MLRVHFRICINNQNYSSLQNQRSPKSITLDNVTYSKCFFNLRNYRKPDWA